MTGPILEAKELGQDYPIRGSGPNARPGKLVAVDRVSFSIFPGEILGLAGESGCGKSTLARLLCRLETPARGEILFQGRSLLALPAKELRHLRSRFQPVFQDPLGSLNPRFTVLAALGEALRLHDRPAGRPALTALLARVGLGPELLTRFPHQLSGGQRQRIGLARALAMEPELLVADEPLSSLDVSIQAQIANLILELQKELHLSVLLISHDLRVVGHLSDRMMVMYLGRIMELAPTPDLVARPRHPYTLALFQALPRLAPGRQRRRSPLPGERPSPRDPQPGCRFFSRCPFREPACQAYENILLESAPGHWVACRRWADLPTPADAETTRPSSR